MASNNLIVNDKNIFTSLLYIDELRGEHSTGIAAIDKNSNVAVYKKALKASDFIQLKGYGNTIAKADRILMGHNRYATMGARDDNNAHPFTHGSITLMHNGTLTNKHQVNRCNATFCTDSETIAWALDTDDAVQVLERLEGAYALVWYDSVDRVLHFARNEERPLYIGKLGRDLVWASEKAMLELVAEHHKKSLTEVVLLSTGKIVMFDLDNLAAEPEIIEFVPKPKPVVYTPPRGGYYNQGNYQQQQHPRRFKHTLGRTIEATLISCKQTGYFEAVSDDGAHVTGAVSGTDITAFVVGAAASKRIRGNIASSTNRYHENRYQEVFHLSGNTVEILPDEEVADSGTEKKRCLLCGSSTSPYRLDSWENHYGEWYHSRCLDGEEGFQSFYGD